MAFSRPAEASQLFVPQVLQMLQDPKPAFRLYVLVRDPFQPLLAGEDGLFPRIDLDRSQTVLQMGGRVAEMHPLLFPSDEHVALFHANVDYRRQGRSSKMVPVQALRPDFPIPSIGDGISSVLSSLRALSRKHPRTGVWQARKESNPLPEGWSFRCGHYTSDLKIAATRRRQDFSNVVPSRHSPLYSNLLKTKNPEGIPQGSSIEVLNSKLSYQCPEASRWYTIAAGAA